MTITAGQIETHAGLQVRRLGRLGYKAALDLQREVNLAVSTGELPATLLLVEHDPVITISRRRAVEGHLVAGAERLAELGIVLEETDRGGDITYHGPGQLVAYPIIRMNPLKLNLSRYMRWLEQVVIDTVACYGVPAGREKGATGVWTPTAGGGTAKLCAMGVRVRKNTTMHGLAINVATDLSHFQTIVPCGLHGRGVTSLQRLLGDACPSLRRVEDDLVRVMSEQFAVNEAT